jgi:hypothetical protein
MRKPNFQTISMRYCNQRQSKKRSSHRREFADTATPSRTYVGIKPMLGELDEAKQDEIARFVGRKILESYRNGIESVKILEAGKKAQARSERVSRKA